MTKIRVLVVDDSAFMRYTLSHHLGSQPDMEVVGMASDGLEALGLVETLRPDVITLDVEMPRLDGLSAVVMMSSLTKEGAAVTVEALTAGAVDFVTKPSQTTSVHQVLGELVEKVRQAARVRVRAPAALLGTRPRAEKGSTPASGSRKEVDRVVVVGSSTGGPGALRELFARLPADLPAGMVVVQHMPANFTRSLAERLDELSPMSVKEAEKGDRLYQGWALVAPGGYHVTLTRTGQVQLSEGPPVNGVKPAVDVTLMSAVAAFGEKALAVILTGMGHDGRDGARALKQAGGMVFAQDEETCVVYGMPRSVVEAGLADAVLPIEEMSGAVAEALRGRVSRNRAVRLSV